MSGFTFRMESFIQGGGPVNRLGSSSENKVLSSVVAFAVSQPSIVLTFMGGVDMGDGSDGSGDWEL